MRGKDSAHRQNPLPCGPIAKKVDAEPQGTEETFVSYDPSRLQQAHRCVLLFLDHESLGFQQATPFGAREGPGAVVDRRGQVMLDGTLAGFVQIVGRQA